MNRFKNAFNEYKKKFQKIEEEVNFNNNNNIATVNIDASSSSSFSSNKINNTMKNQDLQILNLVEFDLILFG